MFSISTVSNLYLKTQANYFAPDRTINLSIDVFSFFIEIIRLVFGLWLADTLGYDLFTTMHEQTTGTCVFDSSRMFWCSLDFCWFA